MKMLRPFLMLLLSMSIIIISPSASSAGKGKRNTIHREGKQRLKRQSKQAKWEEKEYKNLPKGPLKIHPSFRLSKKAGLSLIGFIIFANWVEIAMAGHQTPSQRSQDFESQESYSLQGNKGICTTFEPVSPQAAERANCSPFTPIGSIPPLDLMGQMILNDIRGTNLTVPNAFSIEENCLTLTASEKKEIIETYYKTIAPKVISFIQMARASCQNVGIIMGEVHDCCRCLVTEVELYKTLSRLGITSFFVEQDSASLKGYEDKLMTWTSKPSRQIREQRLVSIYGGWNNDERIQRLDFLSRLSYARSAGFQLRAAESIRPRFANPEEFFDRLRNMEGYLYPKSQLERDINAAVDNRYPNYAAEVEKDQRNFPECIAFKERDKQMANNLDAAEGDYLNVVGAAHLGPIKEFLPPRKNRQLLVLSCAPKEICLLKSRNKGESLMTKYTSPQCERNLEEVRRQKEFVFEANNPCILWTGNEQ